MEELPRMSSSPSPHTIGSSAASLLSNRFSLVWSESTTRLLLVGCPRVEVEWTRNLGRIAVRDAVELLRSGELLFATLRRASHGNVSSDAIEEKLLLHRGVVVCDLVDPSWKDKSWYTSKRRRRDSCAQTSPPSL